MEKNYKNYKKLSINTLLIVAIILIAVISLQASFAVTYNINNSTTGGINGTLAIDATDGDTILLEEGTYTGNNNTNITINKNITIQGNGSRDKVIIDAQGLSRIFAIGNNLNVTFINITFINGKFAGHGGAIFNNYTTTTMTITNCTFINNQAINTTVQYYQSFGGAIYDNGNNTIITNCNFTNNAAYGRGGAIFTNGYNTTLKDCNFNDNNAYSDDTRGNNGTYSDDGNGGAVHSQIKDLLTVMGCNFTDNKADQLGAGFYASGASRNLTFIDCNFINNIAIGDGGAMQITGITSVNISVSILRCNFTNNKALNFNSTGNNLGGGAIIIGYCQNSIIDKCNFINNTAGIDGGAIWCTNQNITNCNFINNSAGDSGGAILIRERFNSIGAICYNNIFYNTFFGNVAGINGGTICNSGNLTVLGNVMSGNTAGLGQMIYNYGTIGILNLTFLNNSTYVVINGSTATIYATLTDDMGNTVTGQNITFYINGILGGVLVKSIESIEGNVSFNIAVVGEGGDLFPVYGSYDGIGDYSLIINEGLLSLVEPVPYNITKIATNSSISAKNITVGKLTTIKGVAKDVNGNVLVNTKLTLTVDGKKYTVTTNSGGEWNLKYTPTHKGNINVQVSFAGNTTYYGFVNSTRFNVAGSKLLSNGTKNDTPGGNDTPIFKPNPIPNSIGNTNKTSNNPAATAAMKNTGVPIITIILFLLATLGIFIGKKQK